MDKVKLNNAFQSAPLEVLVCLKQLHLENTQLKSRLKCERSVHSDLTQCNAFNRHQISSVEVNTSQMDLGDLLSLCSSQADEIFRLKNEMQSLYITKATLERELQEKDLELERTKEVMFRSNEETKIKNSQPIEDASTQTDPEQSDSPRYLRVEGQDPSFPEEEILPQSHGRILFDNMFTPRSRNMSHQGRNLDASSIDRIIDGIPDIIPENSIRLHITIARHTCALLSFRGHGRRPAIISA
jgi:hypothetical protein